MYYVIDCNGICHEVFHGLPFNMMTREIHTSIIYGFLKKIFLIAKMNQGGVKFLFCWDSRDSKRKEIYTPYKSKRNNLDKLTKEEIKRRNIAYNQFDKLRDKILPGLGFKNVYWQKGIEADDFMALICKRIKKSPIMIYTSDKDMYQLLSKRVAICKTLTSAKSNFMTVEKFKNDYGIEPEDWVFVKAIGGCTSDNVKGLTSIAEKTAIKYLKGDLKPTTKAYKMIMKNRGAIKLYRKLVELPFEDIKIKVRQDELTFDKFAKIFSYLGFKSFVETFDKWEQYFNLK